MERLAEMQEELLWFGEACHLPVIWATEAVRMLADIIRKMEKHQFKKRSLYRPLALARAT